MQRIRVGAWPAFSNSKSNPYQSRLYGEIAREHEVVEISMSRRSLLDYLRNRFDVVHIHWIERAFWGSKSRRAVLKSALLTMAIFCLFKVKRTRIIWTVHDPIPHEMAENARFNSGPLRLLWLAYRFVLLSSIDGLIFLSPSHVALLAKRFPRLGRLPHCIIRHPHYRGVYPNTVSKSQARESLGVPPGATTIVFVGKIRPYKNVDGLMRAFRAYRDPDVRLAVAGEADTVAYGKELKAMADADERILLSCSFVPDDALQNYLNAADVVLLPFREVTNSGSLLLVLSFDRPVAVPDAPVFREVREIVGPDWIHLYGGDIGPETIASVVDWSRSRKSSGSPPMDSLSWPQIAAQTVNFYSELTARRS